MNEDFSRKINKLVQSSVEVGDKKYLAQDLFLKMLQEERHRRSMNHTDPESSPRPMSADDLTQIARQSWQAAEVFNNVTRQYCKEYRDAADDLFRDLGGSDEPENLW